MKVAESGGRTTISLAHSDQVIGRGLLMEALGTADFDFGDEFIDQLLQIAVHGGKADASELNFMLAVIKGVRPNDQLEAMLGAQMGAVHMLAMKLAKQFSAVETLPQQDGAERALNKLMRTFVMQMEALKRYRTGGEQKVTVQHVSVGEGGQAIVGNVTQTAPKNAKGQVPKETPVLAEARDAPMPSVIDEEVREPVPVRRPPMSDDEE